MMTSLLLILFFRIMKYHDEIEDFESMAILVLFLVTGMILFFPLYLGSV